MKFMRALLTNHPLANIAFVVVLLLGLVSYNAMPREQDPEINFNWVSVTAVLPGASAEEVERLITNPLEDAIKGVADVRFVISSSRENISSMLVRFREINERTFDKRMADLRREIQNKATSELPREAKDPMILEITTSNGFPTAALMLTGQADDETLRVNARRIKADLERIAGVDQVYASGLRDPEILISPNAQALAARGLLASDVADSVAAWWRDTSGGTLKTQGGAWSISVKGVMTDPQALEGLPVTATLYGVIALTGIAVNSAIVLIDAANDRMQRGMSTIHAIIQASRRRVVPILITTTTTIGGLFSLAFGLGDQSLLWGPVAASIVWGLAFSTVLTLFVVPLLYLGFMRPKSARATRRWWRWRQRAAA